MWLAVALAVSCASPPPPPAAPPPPASTVLAPIPAPSPSVEPAPAPREAAMAVSGTCSIAGLPSPLWSSRDPSVGDADAPAVLVQFNDFQCPFCSRAARTLLALRQEYGPKRLRIVFKHEPLPFHDHADRAAQVGEGVFELAGSAAFFRYYDEAFENQSMLSADATLLWASHAGVTDTRPLLEGLRDGRFARKVQEDLELSRKIGASGTPHFYINGEELTGAQPIDKFREVIDRALMEAEAVRRAGVTGDIPCRMAQANLKDTPQRVAEKKDPPSPAAALDDAVWNVPVGASPVRGAKDALVTVVEFAGYQCPFSKRVEPTIAKVLSTYGPDVRLVWKDLPLPFHDRSGPSARLARLVLAEKGADAFWKVHDRLFETSPELSDAKLRAIAAEVGLSAARADTAISGKTKQDAVDVDLALADEVNASGTPHFFINGRRLVGAQPFEKLKEAIDRELGKARALVAAGTPRAKVYETTIKDGKRGDAPEKKTLPRPTAQHPSRGAAGAKVVIQECSDFQCPFCNRVQPTLKQVLAEYPGKVRLVFRNLPLSFHKDAFVAAEAAHEAFAQKGADGFWKMHDLLYEKQSDLSRGALDAHAGALGLDVPRFRAALDSGKHRGFVQADIDACNGAGITGTPGFTVNGYFVSGAQPFAKFKKVIDRALQDR
jgi:protein-disulfide isomerase